MANRFTDGRYLPALAALLFVLLGLIGYWLFGLATSPVPTARPVAFAAALHSQAASLQVRMAFAGDDDAFAALEKTRRALFAIGSSGLSGPQQERLDQVRSGVTTFLEGREDIQQLADAAAKLRELEPKFTDSLYALEGALSIQKQPTVIAHLERLRLLTDAMLVDVEGLVAGNTGSADLTRRLVDSEMEFSQIIRALQAGDPKLGLSPVTGEETDAAVAALVRRSEQLRSTVRDALSLSDRLNAIRQAARQLDEAVLAFEPNAALAGSSETLLPGRAEYLRLLVLLAVAMLLTLIIAGTYFRTSRQRRATALLAEQTEEDQQAILRLLDEMGSLADGDLTVQATVSEDMTGAIADAVNYAVEALRELVVTIRDSAILVDGAAREAQASAHTMAAASDAQSRQVHDASEAIRKMSTSVDEVAGDAERSEDVARHSVDVAHKGGDAVRRTIEGMNTIRETIQETSKRIKRLGESSQEIGDIVELINDIADQTNVLALNASIQASMAGEAGRGFAVVADEVQRLAERSATATRQIEVLVRTIQSDTNEAVVSMERSTTDVVGGALLAENAGAALEEIEQVSNQIAMLVQNITSSSREQARGAKAALHNMEKLREISAQTDENATATTGSIGKLATLATQLRESIAGFILPPTASDAQGSPPDEGKADDAAPPPAGDALREASELFADQKTA